MLAFLYAQRWRIVFFFGAVVAGFAFLMMTLLVRADYLHNFDFAATVKLQEHLSSRFDEMGVWLGTLAKFQVIVPFLIVFLLLMRRWVLALASLALLFFTHVVEIVGKAILFQPPPPFMFYRHRTEFIFPELHTLDTSSYPSGHSMRTLFVVMILMIVIWKTKRIPVVVRLFLIALFAAFAVGVMVSRIALGEHWTTDVIGGAFLGVMIGCIAWMCVDK
jgi:membrane-associated phospholipid phosphatase